MKKQTSTFHRMLPAFVAGKAAQDNVTLPYEWIKGLREVGRNNIFAITLITSIYIYGRL
ncbi:hypothetical protein QQ020_33495 [Fulvivirgaceae bacterium BMA12]|uniref:Uncharacterized protein n=1 Tax=Agaribacillus aureus TaxID=3051825 RepID=A0ABT8LGU7_9BACT|nr:hypothetical protein [Fulvivirgaceae bacterium BMA12]